MIFAMMSDLAMMSPSKDGMVIAVRALTTLVLPIGAAIALWNAWTVLRSKRSLWAKLWSIVLAAVCVALLFDRHRLPPGRLHRELLTDSTPRGGRDRWPPRILGRTAP